MYDRTNGKGISAYDEDGMGYTTYENTHNPHVTIHRDSCRQIKKRGGVHQYNQGKYQYHDSYDAAISYARGARLPLVICSFCNPEQAETDQPMSSDRTSLLRQAAQRGKYNRLHDHLMSRAGNEWQATFGEIEKIIGFRLPTSARVHRPWWSNQGEQGGHSHALAWEMAGWKTSVVDMSKERLIFVRESGRLS